MEIRPEDAGLSVANLSAVNAPLTGLPTPELAALLQKTLAQRALLQAGLIQPADVNDVVTLLDVAASDLVQLAEILEPPGLDYAPLKLDQAGQVIRQALILRPANPDPAVEPTTAAKLDAEVKLNQAEQTIEQAGGRKLPHWETAPETLLQIGHRLYDAGGYSNYVRAAEVATAIQSAYWEASIIYEQTASAKSARLQQANGWARYPSRAKWLKVWTASRKNLPERIRVLWRRAPLLVLFLTWLVVGLIGGALVSPFGFEFWAAGFLALVGLGFYARIRS
ncbi:MAG TPA: hypothetical protein VK604_26610 [Bryobacteraceae bacterium]|nr:hypothetical protein [Bryobacteraceae bacterium]